LKTLIRSVFTCLFSFAMVSCNTVMVSERQSEESTEDINWSTQAQQAESIETFTVAINNMILLSDNDSLKPFLGIEKNVLNALDTNGVGINGRPALLRNTRLIEFGKEIGSVCLPADQAEWRLVRSTYPVGGESATLDYRIVFEEAYTWCTLTVKESELGYQIVNYRNNYHGLSLEEYMSGFVSLDTNKALSFSTKSKSGSDFYSAVESGYEPFKSYVADNLLDSTDPLVQMILLSLLDNAFDVGDDDYFAQLESFVAPESESTDLPVQQLVVDLNRDADDSVIEKDLVVIEQLTGDSSIPGIMAADFLVQAERLEFAEKLLLAVIKIDPTFEQAYASLFELFVLTENYGDAVLTLQVLEEKFDYEFIYDDFNSEDEYEALVASAEFRGWLFP